MRSVFDHFRPSTRKGKNNGEKIASLRRCMTSPYSKTSVFVHLHENDKRAFRKNTLGIDFENLRFWWSKTSFFWGRKAKREKTNIRIVFYWPIKIEINAGRHFRIKIRETAKRDSLQTRLRFPSIFSFPWHATLFFLDYPSAKQTFCPKWEVSVNIGLGEG